MVMESPQHTITALVQDRPGVLNRVTGMIRRRNFNISSLAVGPSEVAGLSRMTFVVEGDEATLEQVIKQLRKLIDVVRVSHVDRENCVSREIALVRIKATPETRAEIIQIVNIFRADIVDVAHDSMIIEVTGDEEKVGALTRLLKPFGIGEVMRSGLLAMTRGVAEPTDGEGDGPRAAAPRRRGRVKDELGW
jgi:acetolactate synthase-1/3 small subunit